MNETCFDYETVNAFPVATSIYPHVPPHPGDPRGKTGDPQPPNVLPRGGGTRTWPCSDASAAIPLPAVLACRALPCRGGALCGALPGCIMYLIQMDTRTDRQTGASSMRLHVSATDSQTDRKTQAHPHPRPLPSSPSTLTRSHTPVDGGREGLELSRKRLVVGTQRVHLSIRLSQSSTGGGSVAFERDCAVL